MVALPDKIEESVKRDFSRKVSMVERSAKIPVRYTWYLRYLIIEVPPLPLLLFFECSFCPFSSQGKLKLERTVGVLRGPAKGTLKVLSTLIGLKARCLNIYIPLALSLRNEI